MSAANHTPPPIVPAKYEGVRDAWLAGYHGEPLKFPPSSDYGVVYARGARAARDASPKRRAP